MSEPQPLKITQDHFVEAAERLGLDMAARDLLTWAMREYQAAVPIVMDDGSHRTFHAYRVRHNHARGPTIGGIRWHPDMSIEALRTFAAQMSWQTAVADLPLGGACGGVDCNPKVLSTAEKERLARGYTRALGHQMGIHRDVPIPDLYTTPQTMAWMMDEYESMIGESRPGTTAGKPPMVGGSVGHGDAGARSAALLVREAAAHLGLNQSELTYAIQGFGNAGRSAASLHPRILGGGRLIAISDSRGGITHPDGLDPAAVIMHKLQTGAVAGFPAAEPISNEELLELEVDVLYPAAVSDVISAGNSGKIKAKIVCELADNPSTPKADAILYENKVFLIPGILTNAGHVIVAYLELLQNASSQYWQAKEIHAQLEQRITAAFRDVVEMSESEGVHLRLAAWMVGIARVAEACRARGWC